MLVKIISGVTLEGRKLTRPRYWKEPRRRNECFGLKDVREPELGESGFLLHLYAHGPVQPQPSAALLSMKT